MATIKISKSMGKLKLLNAVTSIYGAFNIECLGYQEKFNALFFKVPSSKEQWDNAIIALDVALGEVTLPFDIYMVGEE